MIDKLNNRLSGVYLVEIKWGLVWFKDVIQQTDQSMKYEKFINLLLQKFNEDYVLYEDYDGSNTSRYCGLSIRPVTD